MRVCITHDAGVAEWPKGAVVELDDRRASRLVRSGYAIEQPQEPPPVKRKKD